MKTVRIINGIYGYRPNGSSRVKTQRHGDTCELPEAEAARLVQLNVAEYVDNIAPELGARAVATGAESENGGETGGNMTDEKDGSEGEEKATTHLDADKLMEMARGDMDRLAIDMGADPAAVKKAKNKAEVAAIIASIEIEPGDDGEEPPSLGTEDPQA